VGAVGVTDENLRVWAKCLNCRRMSLLFKYLGMKIGGNPRKRFFGCQLWRRLKRDSQNGKGKYYLL